MGQLTYRIPATAVLLQDDGMLVPKPAEGATLIEATPANAPALTAAYVGGGLHWNNKGVADNIFDALGALPQERAALKSLVELADSVVLIGDVVELSVKIADWMGWLGPKAPDPVMAILEWLDRRLNQIEDSVLEAWASSRRDQLALLRSYSTTALQFAQQYLELGRPNDAIWANKVALADHDSLFAVNAFVDSGVEGGFWMRPFSLKALGINPNAVQSSWLGHYPNQADVVKSPVWDYRFTLPAALYAIITRIAVLKAVAPDMLARGRSGCREVKRYARFLRAVAEKMQGGIWSIQDLDLSPWWRNLFLWDGRMKVAAANIYSGHGHFRVLYHSDMNLILAGLWGSELWPAGLVDAMSGAGNDQVIERGRHNARLIGSHWWHMIWRAIGMIEMCQVISDVDSVCTAPRFVTSIGNAQRMILTAQKDSGAKKAASVSTALVSFGSEGDSAADAARTFQLYRALHEGGEPARQVIARCTEELLRLAPPLDTAASSRTPL